MDNNKLQGLVEKISREFFQKEFCHKAYFNPRLRTVGGRYLLSTHNIEINKKYYDEFGEKELVGIIKHELCHYHLHIQGLGYHHRERDFKDLMKKVEAPRFCSSLPNRKINNRIKKILLYSCESCKQIYKRKRAINTSKYVCGKCRGKLVKVKELTYE